MVPKLETSSNGRISMPSDFLASVLPATQQHVDLRKLMFYTNELTDIDATTHMLAETCERIRQTRLDRLKNVGLKVDDLTQEEGKGS